MEPGRFEPTGWREWRRLRAWHLKQSGWNQRQIAIALDAGEGTVSRWLARARRDGPKALLAVAEGATHTLAPRTGGRLFRRARSLPASRSSPTIRSWERGTA
jgi:transposase